MYNLDHVYLGYGLSNYKVMSYYFVDFEYSAVGVPPVRQGVPFVRRGVPLAIFR